MGNVGKPDEDNQDMISDNRSAIRFTTNGAWLVMETLALFLFLAPYLFIEEMVACIETRLSP